MHGTTHDSLNEIHRIKLLDGVEVDGDPAVKLRVKAEGQTVAARARQLMEDDCVFPEGRVGR